MPSLIVRSLIPLVFATLASQGLAQAGTQKYEVALAAVNWTTSSTKQRCTLSQTIPEYGQAIFMQNAGESLRFEMHVKHQATRDRDIAHLRSIPPGWKHHTNALDMGETQVVKGNIPFQLRPPVSQRMLTELKKGMFPTFSYRDWTDASDLVTVSLPGVSIKGAMDTFSQCLAKLPVYKFDDYRESLVKFATNKAELTAAARKRLDEVVRYIQSADDVKKVEISGHTDDIGQLKANDSLGKKRSNAVREYLISKGVPVKLFKVISLGERNPVDSNKTNSGRANNRRATVTLVN